MEILQHVKGENEACPIANEIQHMEKDSDDCLTIYMEDGIWVTLDKQDITDLIKTWNGPSYENLTEFNILKGEMGDFSP